MSGLIDVNWFIRRPRNGAARERRMKRSKMKRQAIKQQSGKTEASPQFADQSRIIKVMTFVSAKPFYDGKCGG